MLSNFSIKILIFTLNYMAVFQFLAFYSYVDIRSRYSWTHCLLQN